jgi:hypothetical protein
MTTITESQWVNYFGFQRFPFDRPEAGNEEFARPEFLASCFIEPKAFERVFGQADSPTTSLLFAARGTGKTACRVMMDYYCQNGLARLSFQETNHSNYVLSIPHIRLDNVLDISRKSTPNGLSTEVLLEHHVIEIFRQAVKVLVYMVSKQTIFTNKVKSLSKADFKDLSLYLVSYSTYLTSAQKEFLDDFGVDLSLQGLEPLPLHHFEQWVKMMTKIGITSTYVLVDGVDELTESAGDPNYAHRMIRPLFTNLRLMDGTHHLALKFFLPSDMEQPVLSDPAFRAERGFVIERIRWVDEDLIMILRERLNVLRRDDFEIRDRTAAGFDNVCVPDLSGDVERYLAQYAS